MMIKQNSKTLNRVYDEKSGIFTLYYHATPVVRFNSVTRELTLNNGGWITCNTARAMNFAIEELNLSKEVSVKFTKSKKVDNVPTLFVNGVNRDTICTIKVL